MSHRRYMFKNAKNKTYICIIMPLVLYGCETWSLTLMEGHRLCVFENRVLRDIFGPKKEEATGDCRKLHDQDLHILFTRYWVIKLRIIRWVGHVERKGEKRNESFSGQHWRKQTTWNIWDGRPWTRGMLMRMGQYRRSLWTQEETFRFHKMLRISWLAEKLLASQEVHYSTEFVTGTGSLTWL